MRIFIKPLLAFLIVGSAFFVGLYLGEEKVKTKIPNYQEDFEEKI